MVTDESVPSHELHDLAQPVAALFTLPISVTPEHFRKPEKLGIFGVESKLTCLQIKVNHLQERNQFLDILQDSF